MSLRQGFLILGACILVFLVALLLLGQSPAPIPLSGTYKVLIWLTVGTAVLGLAAIVAAVIERAAKGKGLGRYVLGAVAVSFLAFSLMF